MEANSKLLMIEVAFELGSILYLRTDLDQKARLLTGVSINVEKNVRYLLACGETETFHFACEISEHKSVLEPA